MVKGKELCKTVAFLEIRLYMECVWLVLEGHHFVAMSTYLHQHTKKKRFRLGTHTYQKAEGLMASGGLNRFMASQPRTHSSIPFKSLFYETTMQKLDLRL